MPHFFLSNTDATKVLDGRTYPTPPTVVLRVISSGTLYYSDRRDDLIPDSSTGKPRNATPFSSTDINALQLYSYSGELWLRSDTDRLEVSVQVHAVEPKAKWNPFYVANLWDKITGKAQRQIVDDFGTPWGRKNPSK